MKLAGFDPSITAAGLAVIERRGAELPQVLELATIRTESADPIEQRYRTIFDAVGRRVREHHIELVAIEEQRQAQLGAMQRGEFNYDNSKTLIALGAAIGAAFAYGAEIVFVAPQTVKVAVLGKGGGRATKQQVKDAVRALIARAGIKRFSADAADALATAIAGERAQRLAILKEGAR